MMNDGKLSQEEIDALLNVSDDGEESTEEAAALENAATQEEAGTEENQYLSSMEIDALGEIGNISFGSSATTLSTLLRQKVEITTPVVTVIEKEELEEEVTFKPVSVQVNYIEGFTGNNVFVIKAEDAAIIADIMLGGDGTTPDTELNEIHLSAVQEAMNQMMGSAATSMSTVFNKKIDISPPSIIHGIADEEKEEIFDQKIYVKVFFRLMVGDLIDSNMVQLIPLAFAKELVDLLMNPAAPEAENELVEQLPEKEPQKVETMDSNPIREQQPAAAGSSQRNEGILGNASSTQQSNVQEAAFSDFDNVPLNNQEQRNLDMLMDIPLKVTVELGRTKQSIKEILELSAGSIIELDKLAGEPVDILVNDKLVAEGEVVVIDENFGVRVTDVISQTDRIQHLRK